MTLAEHALAAIKADWDGDYPDNLRRIDQDNSVLLEDAPGFGLSFGDSFGNRNRLGKDADPQAANLVKAGTGTRTRTQTGIGVDRVEAVVEVRVEAAQATIHGETATASAFDQLVDDIVQVFRSDRFEPAVGDLDPATFVRVRVENQDSSSRLYGDYFVSEFELRYIGERT